MRRPRIGQAEGDDAQAQAAAATTSGQDYLLLNLRGNGKSFARLKRTIVAAWREEVASHDELLGKLGAELRYFGVVD